MTNLHKGEVGKTILVRFVRTVSGVPVALDISTATTKELRVRKPDGVEVEFELEFLTDGSDGLARYITESADDLDVVGMWTVQGHVSGAGFDWYTTKPKMLVENNVSDP